MVIFRANKESKEWRQLVAFISAILVFPLVAYVSVRNITPELDFSTTPVILTSFFCWVAVSFFARLFIKENIK
jgi:hypothetical protein